MKEEHVSEIDHALNEILSIVAASIKPEKGQK